MAGEREENDDQPLLVRYAAQSPVTARRSLWPLTLNRARHTEASHAQQRQIVPVSMSILLVLISPFSSFFLCEQTRRCCDAYGVVAPTVSILIYR